MQNIEDSICSLQFKSHLDRYAQGNVWMQNKNSTDIM